ncbi:alpha/beta hydrolase [Azospirillum picis]|uniref:Pimeloyl-ACP methyl ester carboxylesterase n=1 Tax=Azospirillum picis TaxID=488438 RepID=A0ABU0MHW7_9PROT|nr:alpha/beta hydrolase [Azospirillum picis]MBP2299313.1 pimeloyl-ACP methyl ester carboxylesterase [Azospirillum picis]MDQ0533049.1 pimeloyl-ACP methyl ester carboxylesterase [Azospirillum picis]
MQNSAGLAVSAPGLGDARRRAVLGLCRILLPMVGLAACTAMPAERLAEADAAARSAGLLPHRFDAPPFTLAGWLRAGNEGPLVVYIEGDGYAWLSPTQPSNDPTPLNPVALRLARRDPAARLLYLGRPCQYGGVSADAACQPRYWTSHRFSPEVLASLGHALDEAERLSGAGQLVLVGYSGGGVAAALLAARRNDVAALVTVVAPLDLAAWAKAKGLTPLSGSLDPAQEAGRLARVPQWHIAGGKDRVVPAIVQRGFAARIAAPVTVVPGMEHDGDWPAIWPDLRAAFPPAGASAVRPPSLR